MCSHLSHRYAHSLPLRISLERTTAAGPEPFTGSPVPAYAIDDGAIAS